jgi:hypothetical protein
MSDDSPSDKPDGDVTPDQQAMDRVIDVLGRDRFSHTERQRLHRSLSDADRRAERPGAADALRNISRRGGFP